MEEQPVSENIGKKHIPFHSRLKIITLALLMLSALAAGGIFISSAHASSLTEPTKDTMKQVNGCQIAEDDGVVA